MVIFEKSTFAIIFVTTYFAKFCKYKTRTENWIEFGFSKEKSDENFQNRKNR